MYLTHNTAIQSIKKILKDGELKAAKFTGRTNEGWGVYKAKEQSYVFFSTTPILFDIRLLGNVTLYLKPDFLSKKDFTIANAHIADPSEEYWNYNARYPIYNKKIKATKNYLKYLKKLYADSLRNKDNIPLTIFQMYNQVTVKNKINLKDNLVAITIDSRVEYIVNNIIKIIKKHYPNVKLFLRPYLPGGWITPRISTLNKLSQFRKDIKDNYTRIFGWQWSSIKSEGVPSKSSLPKSQIMILHTGTSLPPSRRNPKKINLIGTTKIVWLRPGYAELLNVKITDEYKGKGLCFVLVYTAIQHYLLQFPKTKIILHVSKNNIPAIKCYQHVGFNPIELSWFSQPGLLNMVYTK